MLNYINFKVEDFLKDNSFRKWTLDKNTSEAKFWELWLDIHPDKVHIVAEAQLELLTHNDELGHIEESEIDEQIHLLQVRISDNASKKGKVIEFFTQKTWYAVAASVALLIGVSYVFIFSPKAGIDNLISLSGKNANTQSIVTEINNSNKSKLVLLPDGSSLILASNSTVSFPKEFESNKRELNLSGEAFFEISKDKSKPFYIYTEGLTTRVVGTSFSIRAFKNAKEVKIMVKTGIVSVMKKEDAASEVAETKATILKQNQQIVYNVAKKKIEQSVISQKEETDFIIQKQLFVFNETPLEEVFQTLENSYGLTINSEVEKSANCHLTATLGDEPFEVKLNLICEAVDATYTREGDTINIKLKGCH